MHGPNFLAERRQQLKPLTTLQNAHLALAVAERAVREAETLTGTDRKSMAPVGPALDAYWKLISAGVTVLTPELQKYHKKLVDRLPKDPEEEGEVPAWDSAISVLALAFMVLVDPKKAFDTAASACGEGSRMVTMYYTDMAAARKGEVDWQDRVIDLIKVRLPQRDEFAALPDYTRGPWEEPD